MKKLLFAFPMLMVLSWFQYQLNAQCNLKSSASSSIRIQMLAESGSNAASIVWNPENKKYYAIMAGNESFPIEVFDSRGNSLFHSLAKTDVRGLWFNPSTNSIEGNAYSEKGWFTYSLTPDGNPNDLITLREGMNQTGENCSGSFDPQKKIIYFYDGGDEVQGFSRKNGKIKSKITLKGSPVSYEDYNSTTVVFTGCKGKELALLNYEQSEVHLYSIKGKYAGLVSLETDGLTVEDRFNFSYTNNTIFLFDTYSKVWTGFKIFE